LTLPALTNFDFAAVRTAVSDAGPALRGIGMGAVDNRAGDAAQRAISSPLLETSIEGARSILLSITGGGDLSLVEISEAAKVIQEAAHPDAHIIFGANVDDTLDEQIWVTVIATRFDSKGRRADGTSTGIHRSTARPSARRASSTQSGSRKVRGYEQGGGDLDIDVPEFIPN
ncbi:MAG: cell division protein FtsZ, partial [Solirubrobacterales bacterium]